MRNQQGKFKLIIKNNENGKTIVDKNTNGIMLALTEEKGVRQVILTSSTSREILHMIKVLNDIIKEQTSLILHNINHNINMN